MPLLLLRQPLPACTMHDRQPGVLGFANAMSSLTDSLLTIACSVSAQLLRLWIIRLTLSCRPPVLPGTRQGFTECCFRLRARTDRKECKTSWL